MQFNTTNKELTIKVVYYGPALSGKTTNIEALHQVLDPASRGRLMNLDTKGDRTLFFDLLPVHFQTRSGFKVKIKLFTVPGQVMHESTRRIVLAGADAVIFIADAQREQLQANNEAFAGLHRNLRANGLDPTEVPVVIQFNKLDLPNAITEAEIADYERGGEEPIYRATAIRGQGVVETLQGCLELLWARLTRQYDFKRKFGISKREFMDGVFTSVRMPVRPEAQP